MFQNETSSNFFFKGNFVYNPCLLTAWTNFFFLWVYVDQTFEVICTCLAKLCNISELSWFALLQITILTFGYLEYCRNVLHRSKEFVKTLSKDACAWLYMFLSSSDYAFYWQYLFLWRTIILNIQIILLWLSVFIFCCKSSKAVLE